MEANKYNKKTIELSAHFRTALMDGTLVPDSEFHMASEDFYHAYPGDKLKLCDGDYLYSVALFTPVRDDRFIFTYDYQKEENWTTYTQNVTPDSYTCEEYEFDGEYFFRINVKRRDEGAISSVDEERKDNIVVFFTSNHSDNTDMSVFESEIRNQIERTNKYRSTDSLCITLLSDSHNVTNGTWKKTIANIKAVSSETKLDAIVHLGDLTDGMVSKELTRKKVKSMIKDMQDICQDTYITLGNHDYNYFRNRDRAYSDEEIKEVYDLPDGPNYTVEIADKHLTMIFLDSFDDNESVRYGYSNETLEWLQSTMDNLPDGQRVLVFTHCPPLGELDYWSYHIRNGRRLVKILDDANTSDRCDILGLIYGHTHADYQYNKASFPMIGIACNKLEYFHDKKPKKACVPKREVGKVTEDLWDNLIVDFENKKLLCIRFGSKIINMVSFASKNAPYERVIAFESKRRNTKVWAHRGASGYVPENTIPAFQIALEMGADGIETDVQLTKDGIPVIIHDECIDRVSDGQGYVRDYTLEELKKFNFNNQMQRWGFVQIPTLEEFFECFIAYENEFETYSKGCKTVINLELKNGIVNYKGLEEKVIEMVERFGLENQVIYSSFNHESMVKVKMLKPEAKVGLLFSHILANPVDYALANNADALHPWFKVFDFSYFVNKSMKNGIRIHTWTVNEAEDIAKMKEMGVNSIITNYLDRCLY